MIKTREAFDTLRRTVERLLPGADSFTIATITDNLARKAIHGITTEQINEAKRDS